MRLSVVEIVLFLAAAAVAATALPRCSGGRQGGRVTPASWTLTPGVVNPAVTQANSASIGCRHGWTRTVRPPDSYTTALKAKGLHQYRLRGPPSAFQEDHLISLELGGDPADPRNLWPESYPRASAVDRMENDLNAQVCSGSLSLAQAQLKEAQLKHTQG